MREILFRGKRIDNNEFVHGSLYVCGRKDGKCEIANYDRHLNIERFAYEVLPETVGQYTGLTDKNGKKIFEGDIVKNEYGYIGLIVMKACSYYIEWQSGNFSNDLYVFADTLEVIGNIHDNPELLKEADDDKRKSN